MKRLHSTPSGFWLVLGLGLGIAGCPDSDPDDPPVGIARVDGQLTVDGEGLAGVTISFRDEMDMTVVKNVVTQAGGVYSTTLSAPGNWSASASYSLGDCPVRSVVAQEFDELSVDFPCTSEEVDVGITYTPLQNDCGQPTRDPFEVAAVASAEVEDDVLELDFSFDDGPEPIVVSGILDLESGAYTGESPSIAFEGGSGREVWNLVLDPDGTFEGTIEAEYTFVNPSNSDERFECTEDLEVAGEPLCGNGFPDRGEGCDDGNRESGDGCSRTCEVEF